MSTSTANGVSRPSGEGGKRAPAKSNTDRQRDEDDERIGWTDLAAELGSIGRERDWLVEGFIERTPLIAWIGAEKRAKSWILLSLSVAVALGVPWLGRFPVRRPGPVLVLDLEYGPEESTRRLARIARGIGRQPTDLVGHVHHAYVPWVSLQKGEPTTNARGERVVRTPTDETLAAIWRACERIEPVLVVLDPFRNALPAGADENAAGDVLRALELLRRFRDTHGCAVAIAHHLNKSGSASGSRALAGRVDLIVEGEDNDEGWWRSRGRTIRRADPNARPLQIQVRHEDDEDDTIARTVLTCRLEGEARTSAALGKAADRVLKALRDVGAPTTVTNLRRLTKQNHAEATRALGELEAAGLVTRDASNKWTTSSATSASEGES